MKSAAKFAVVLVTAPDLKTARRLAKAALAARLTRRMRFDLAVTDRHLYLSLGEETLSGAVIAHESGVLGPITGRMRRLNVDVSVHSSL